MTPPLLSSRFYELKTRSIRVTVSYTSDSFSAAAAAAAAKEKTIAPSSVTDDRETFYIRAHDSFSAVHTAQIFSYVRI